MSLPSKKVFFLYTILLLVFITGCQSVESTTATKKHPPNILLILTDDQGWGDLSINGNTNLRTPNIDRLAKNGATFDRFFVSPVCSPTRAEILTGRYALRSGVYSTSQGGERIDLDETTMADYFKAAGYQTGAFGKWHSGMQYPYHPNGRGFDEFYGYCSGHWGNYIDPMLERNGQLVRGKGFLPDDLTDKTIEFIEKNRDQPFFAYLPFNTPHNPMQMPDKWWKPFDNKELTMLGDGRQAEQIGHTKAALAFCKNIDWNVGRIVEKLQELQLEENTILIYLSDNGPNGARWNGGMKGKKGSTDEGGVRSPTFIQWKNTIPAGMSIQPIASSLDLLPTLAEMTGIAFQPDKPLDGKSLKPLLLQEQVLWPDRLIFNHWKNKLSVRNQQFRLGAAGQLFDMENDPEQRTDVATDFPEVYQKLQKAKANWLNTVAQELPEVDPRTFPVGHPDAKTTQIPARDGIASGSIQRSNRWPNCSYFTNWTNENDSIIWDIDVLESGNFEVVLYYTCAPESIGGIFELAFGDSRLQNSLTVAHDPPLRGMETDRFPRDVSFTKDFKPLNIGTIYLEKGAGRLALRALTIPNEELMDFRLMLLNKTD
ncbi:MAG: arylsulfatase [Bacteroidota bacterium]